MKSVLIKDGHPVTLTEEVFLHGKIDIATPLPDRGQHLIEAASLHQTLVGPIHSYGWGS